MNKVILLGRLTKDPEMRTTQSGKNNTTFSLALNRNYKTEDGQSVADFINCTIWNKSAENVVKYCKKGSQVAVEGSLQTRKYQNAMNENRYVTEVNVEQITFLDTRTKNIDDMTNSEVLQAVINDEPVIVSQNSEDPFKDFGTYVELSDEDLPF